MGPLITLIIGAVLGGIGGFLLHVLTMKINFKQRTLDNKIRVYDALIAHWVKTRNFIYAKLPADPQEDSQYDIMYGYSQTFIGEAALVSDDSKLIEDINALNEKLYQEDWVKN